MHQWPPTNTQGQTYSWLFMPLINMALHMAATGRESQANDSQSALPPMWDSLLLPAWAQTAAQLLGTRLRLANITWASLRGYVDGARHLTAAAQEVIMFADPAIADNVTLCA